MTTELDRLPLLCEADRLLFHQWQERQKELFEEWHEAEAEALQARVRELERALKSVRGLMNEMHPHTACGLPQGRCAMLTDFCLTSWDVTQALAGGATLEGKD